MSKRIVEYPVPLAYRQILKDKSSGELIIRGEHFTKNIFFIEGKLAFARTTVIQERLGEILFKLGKINQEQFLNIHKLLEGKKEKLGQILMKEKILTQKDLFFGLLFQIRTIALSAFSLTSGEWAFTTGIPEIPEDSKFGIELPGIIIEGVAKLTNFAYYKNRFYDFAPQVVEIPDSTENGLSPADQKFLKELVGFHNVGCPQIVRQLNLDENVFWRKATLFYLLNIIECKELAVDTVLDKNIEEMLELYEKLIPQKMGHYELFGLEETASPEEIKAVYFDYAKKFHPDRISSAPDPDIKEKANFVFAAINKAYDTLSSEEKRKEYDAKGYKEDSGDDKIRENLVEKARILYRKAKTLYNELRYWEASSLLEEAVRLDPYKSSYFLLLGLSQMNIPDLKRAAERNLQKTIELEPLNAEPYAALGMLFLSEGLKNRAEGFFRKALSIDPDHVLARKRLQEIKKGPAKKKGLFSSFKKKK